MFGGEKPGVPMKIGENIEALELHMNLTGQSSVIYPALLWDSDGATLVDTGIPGQLEVIRRGIENAGVDFQSIDRIVLTHQDVDHIGGLTEILRARGGKIEVLAHEEDKPYIEGDKPLIKMNRTQYASSYFSNSFSHNPPRLPALRPTAESQVLTAI